MSDESVHGPVAGVHPDDIAQFTRVLAGLAYPAQKWQLIAHAGRDPLAARVDPRTIRQLWALPPGRYCDLRHVLNGAAQTARGHPLRTGVGTSHPNRPTLRDRERS
jgi:hypothetical protein